MKYSQYIYLFCIVLFSCKEKSGKLDYETYQYKKTDSLNGHIAKQVRYNENGLIEYEKYTSFITNRNWPTSNVETTYLYKDTLLVKTITKNFNNISRDSSRIEYFYNDKKQLVKIKNFEKYRPFKKGRPTTCLVSYDDYEINSNWRLTHSEFFNYNKEGLKIKKYIPEHSKFQNRFLFEYDKKGRVLKESIFSEDELIEEEFYEYVKNGYNLTYQEEQRGMEEYRFLKDENGNILQEQKKWRGNQMYRIQKEYDNTNRVITEKGYNNKDELKITHNYIYNRE